MELPVSHLFDAALGRRYNFNFSILWGIAVDYWHPDRFDVIGAIIALAGVGVIMWGRQLF